MPPPPTAPASLGDPSAGTRRILGELKALARFIANAKTEIAELRPDEITAVHIPLASDELDAIGGHLEEATGTILDACEAIERELAALPGPAAELLGARVTQIYEACNFQDLTGQRIARVIATLGIVERRIGTILAALDRAAPAPRADRATAAPSADGLLNGPQPAGTAITQSDVDALLAR